MTENTPPALQVPSRRDVIRRHKEGGGLVAAVFPIHYPRALLRGFGVLPVEVWGPPGANTGLGEAHLQAYTCSIIRNGLSFLLGGGLNVADLIVVPHGCDSLQGLGSILLDFIAPRQPVLTLYLPRGDQNEAEKAVRFFADEFRSVYASLSEITGRSPSDSELLEAIRREETADQLLSDLVTQRPRLPFSDREFYRMLRSREFLPAEDFEGSARKVLEQKVESARPGVPVVLSGIVPEPMEVLDAVTEAGGMVVGDDLVCLGRRLYPPGKDEEPFRRMAESILWAPPDSTRGDSIGRRIEHLRRLCKDSAARGVIFYGMKFCEPELFYLPQVRKALAESGIRSVETEGDLGEQLPQQMVTRIEAFLETIQ
jgi:benzoyl-CoA reductase/2-hydroxyglutaryl-CoA dehydratase subunit BcrC/BadD/HgdB